MTRHSSDSGLGRLLGRGFLGLLSIALTATVSVIVQRSFDWMSSRQLPDIPALPGQSEATSSDTPGFPAQNKEGLSSPLPEPEYSTTELTVPEPFSDAATKLDSETSGIEEPSATKTNPETELDAPLSNRSTSRIMQQFWEKLNH